MKINKIDSKKSIYIKGSRVPITYLFDYIANGYSISDFLSSYPWIKREDVEEKLNEFKTKEIMSTYAF